MLSKEVLQSYILNFSFVSKRIYFAYNNDYEVILTNYDENLSKVSGTVRITIGIGESDVIYFETDIEKSDDAISFNTRYRNVNFRAKQKPHFMGLGEYSVKTEGQEFEEVDTFSLVTQNKKAFLRSSNKYLVQSLNSVPLVVYCIGKKYSLENGINEKNIKLPLEVEDNNFNYSLVDEVVRKSKNLNKKY